MSNCDEFLFYDDLVKEQSSQKKRRKAPRKKPGVRKSTASGEKKNDPDPRDDGIDLVLDTAEALIAERGDGIFGSMVKQTLKRRRPGFSETAFGFRSFSELLEEASERGFLKIEADERSGGYVIRSVDRD